MQMSSKKSFTDFKKRIADIMQANNYGEYKTDQFRMWRCENKQNLFKSFDQIAAHHEEEKMEVDESAKGKNFIKFHQSWFTWAWEK